MNTKVKSYLTIVTLIFVLILSGCTKDSSTSQYHKSAKEFNNIYFEIVECIDLKDTIQSLKNLQDEKYSKKIERLEVLVKDIKNNIPKDREKLYDTFNERYENLVFLKKAYSKFDNLNEDERGKIDSIFISIGLDKENWKDKDSSIIWD